jgi:hypothetical protein
MRIGEHGTKHYESGDEVIRLEVRGNGGQGSPRLVAILNVAGKEVEAELRDNLNRCGIGGEPITQAFEGFLRKHGLVEPATPLSTRVSGKKRSVSYVRQDANRAMG